MIDLGGEVVPFVMGRTMVDDAVDTKSLLHLTVVPGGLEKLACAEKVYIFQHLEPVSFSTEFPPLSHYVIVNEKCEDINVVAELSTRGTDKSFILHIFTPGGALVLKMVQRNNDIWNAEQTGFLSDLKRYLERDQQLPTLVQRRTSDSAPQYELAEDKPDAHVHVELPEGIFLGTLWRSDTSWVIHDNYLMPHYTVPLDPDPRYPAKKRQMSDTIYNFYSAGPEINGYSGSPLGKIETNVELYQCGLEAINAVCIGVQYPDHFHVVDKALILGVALNQYCRSAPMPMHDRNNANPSTDKFIMIVCTLLGIILVALAILIAAGVAYTYFWQA